MYSLSRRSQSAKSANTVRDRNSSHSVFQNRSTFPSVCGCCGRLLMCSMPCRRSSSTNAVFPRQATYCLPWSVRISRGAPYSAIPRSSASITSSDFCRCARAYDTMNREWSSMNAARYSRSCRRSRKVKMSDCHSWFGAARSNRRGGCSRAGSWLARSTSSPSSCRIRRTTVSDTPSAWNRRSTSLIRRVPHSGCSSRSFLTASRFAAAAPVRALRFAPAALGASPSSPFSSYRFTQSYRVPRFTPKIRATSSTATFRSRISLTSRIRNSSGWTRRARYRISVLPDPPALSLSAASRRRFLGGMPSLLFRHLRLVVSGDRR
jgi:hypothetical protein